MNRPVLPIVTNPVSPVGIRPLVIIRRPTSPKINQPPTIRPVSPTGIKPPIIRPVSPTGIKPPIIQPTFPIGIKPLTINGYQQPLPIFDDDDYESDLEEEGSEEEGSEEEGSDDDGNDDDGSDDDGSDDDAHHDQAPIQTNNQPTIMRPPVIGYAKTIPMTGPPRVVSPRTVVATPDGNTTTPMARPQYKTLIPTFVPLPGTTGHPNTQTAPPINTPQPNIVPPIPVIYTGHTVPEWAKQNTFTPQPLIYRMNNPTITEWARRHPVTPVQLPKATATHRKPYTPNEIRRVADRIGFNIHPITHVPVIPVQPRQTTPPQTLPPRGMTVDDNYQYRQIANPIPPHLLNALKNRVNQVPTIQPKK
jgi:hypothetical protein